VLAWPPRAAPPIPRRGPPLRLTLRLGAAWVSSPGVAKISELKHERLHAGRVSDVGQVTLNKGARRCDASALALVGAAKAPSRRTVPGGM
jgi:hypothetical protein